jgi:hypothetical protein
MTSTVELRAAIPASQEEALATGAELAAATPSSSCPAMRSRK